MRGRVGRKRPADDGWAERGGYMNAKMQKLAEQNLAASLDSQIFNGITIYVNGYTKPTSEELKTMVIKNGGIYTHYYSKTKVTHIITSNLPTSKINQLRNEKVCRPEWIVESLQAGKLLPYQEYLLYIPQNLRQHNILTSFKPLQTMSADVQTASERVAELPRDTFDGEGKSPFGDNGPLTDENISQKTKDQNFVAEFYNRSRLHHISMWGAESKAYVAKLQKQMSDDKLTPIFKGLERLTEEVQTEGRFLLEKSQKVYAHIDIDCFFVSVGLLKRPELRGQPVAVTHSKGRDPSSSLDGDTGGFNSRSDVASCSYEARKMGVTNGMHFGDAKKICPNLIAIPYDFEAYKRVSQKFYDTVLSYTLEVEAVSCDELYIDCTHLIQQTGASPAHLASCLRKDIFDATSCNSSCGLGSNMLIARLSTKCAKPNGQHYIEPGGEIEFMKEIKVSDLPGIGYVMSKKLTSMGVKSCEELSKLSSTELEKMFGAKVGSRLFKQARGADDRMLKADLERKSVSAEINYGIRFTQKREAENFIKELAKEVRSRLQQLGKKGRQLTLKIKVRQEGAPIETYKFLGHGLCDNVSKSHVLPMATDNADIIGKECCSLLELLNLPAEDLRGIGIQVTSLEVPHGHSTNPTSKNSILKYAIAKSKDLDQREHGDKQPEKLLMGPSRQSDSTGEKSSSPQESTRTEEPQNFFITPSQVDMDTLNELPEDIQREIMNAMKKQRDESTSSRLGANGQKADTPGCSHWNEPLVAKTAANKTLQDQNSTHPELRDFGGLDESFLRAMPEDIRIELLNAHKRPKLLKTSPTKKLQLQAPKSKRGRKKGSTNQTTATKLATKSNVPLMNQQKLVSITKSKHSKPNQDGNCDGNQIHPLEVHISHAERETNFKGCTEAYEVIDLIDLWSLQPAPNQDELNSLLEFLLKLVQESDIEKVLVILRGIQRMENVNLHWKEEMKNITATVQAAVKAIYGGKLKMLAL